MVHNAELFCRMNNAWCYGTTSTDKSLYKYASCLHGTPLDCVGDLEDILSTFKTSNHRNTTIFTMGKGKGKGKGGGQQNNQGKTICNYCKKVGHIEPKCWLKNPHLKNNPQGQGQQQGGGKPKCTFCQKLGHTENKCNLAHPELKGQQGKNQQQQQPQQKPQPRCAYCLYLGHDLDGCYSLHPELTNPFHRQQTGQPQQKRSADEGHDSNNNAPPPARLKARIKHAEQLGLNLTPQNIRDCPKVARIQGWHPGKEKYYTLPVYGVAAVREVYLTDSVFARKVAQIQYEAYDAGGDAIMCTCAHTEGFECHREQWVRKAVKDKALVFSHRSEDGFLQIMNDGGIGNLDEIY